MSKIILVTLLSFFILNANDFKEQTYKIQNVKNNKAQINIGNLKIGQSGVIVHHFKNNKMIILNTASVISSTKDTSIIQFLNNELLKQDSIVNTKLQAKDGDDFILNHMYNVSLLIVPNYDYYRTILLTHRNNFIDTELFAAHLRINDTPVPSKEDIVNFAISNNISTIYIAIQNKIYVLDTLTFKIIKEKEININNTKTQVPFFTNISDISKGALNFTGQDKIKNYNKYYKKLIGVE